MKARRDKLISQSYSVPFNMWLSQCIILYKRELDLDILALGTHQGQIIYYQMNGDCEMEGGD